VIAQQPTQVNGAVIVAPLAIQARRPCVEHLYSCSDMCVRAAESFFRVPRYTLI
jgi:hypothetical protein